MTNHEKNAKTWCEWNGRRGTAKQVRSVATTTMPDTLRRMLAERGLPIAG